MSTFDEHLIAAATEHGWAYTPRYEFKTRGSVTILPAFTITGYGPDLEPRCQKVRGPTQFAPDPNDPDGAPISVRYMLTHGPTGEGCGGRQGAFFSFPLYDALKNGNKIKPGSFVYIVAGETDFLSLSAHTRFGALILSPTSGEGQDLSEFATLLEDAETIILYDNDKAGLECGVKRSRELHGRFYPPPQEGADLRQFIEELGGSLEQILAAPAYYPARPKGIDTLRNFAEEPEEPPPDEIIKGMLVREGVNLLYGPSGSAKSWAALHLAFCAAMGSGYFVGIEDAPVLPADSGPSRLLWIYGAEDSRRRVKRRAELLRVEHYENSPLDAIAFQQLFATESDDGIEQLRASIDWHRPTMVVIDTVSSATGFDPSDQKETRIFINRLKVIAQETRCFFLLIHHTRKAGKDSHFNPYSTDNLLGSNAWRNLPDGIICLYGEDGKIGLDETGIMVVVNKTKDIENKMPMAKVHWDHTRRLFVQGETNREEAQRDQQAEEGAILMALYSEGGSNVGSRRLSAGKYPYVPTGKKRQRTFDELARAGFTTKNGSGAAARYSLTKSGNQQAQDLFRQIALEGDTDGFIGA